MALDATPAGQVQEFLRVLSRRRWQILLPALVVLTVYSPDHGKRILLFDAAAESFRWIPQRPKGDPADGFVRRLRKLLVGAHLERIESKGSRVRAALHLRNRLAWLMAHRGAPVLRDEDGRPLAGRARFAGMEIDRDWTEVEPEVSNATPASSDEDRDRTELGARVRAHLRKLRRKAKAIAKDAARADTAPELRHEAELLRVEGEGVVLIRDGDAGKSNAHGAGPLHA